MKTFTARDYLKIDIANNFGLDKKDWDERIEWFDNNEATLLSNMAEADEPALFYAGVQAWNQVKQGLPIGYPVALDATSSGMQILACLTGDRSAAELCNVVPFREEGKVKRRDGYTVVYNEMTNRIGEKSRIKRNDCKEAIMTALYGSEAMPKQVFGEGMLLKVFEQTMDDKAPAVWELNKFWLTLWNPEAYAYHWILPDNFNVHIKVMDKVCEVAHFLNKPYDCYRDVQQPVEKGRMLSANTTHSIDGYIVRELIRRCSYDINLIEYVKELIAGVHPAGLVPSTEGNIEMVATLWEHYQKSGMLSIRIFDYLDSNTIEMVDTAPLLEIINELPKKPFKVLSVHDCFRVLPNYANDLRRQYNIQLRNIARSNLLGFIMSQVIGQEITVGKLDPELWKDIEETEYALS